MENTDQEESRYREVRRVTLIGSAVDLLLGAAKIAIGVIGSSQALIADGIHSLSDLVTDFMVLFAAKHASRAADEEHPYGHARIETVMTVALGVALIAVAAGIGWDAVRRLLQPELLLHPGWLALAVATVSILAKEWIYHYTLHAARRMRSNLLRANAWHSRSDAISSVIVVVGVLGSMAGLFYLDAIAAVGVALMIARIGYVLSWQSMRELVDTGLDAEQVEAIRSKILSLDGVRALHMLRTRRMGADALVDVHIQVEPKLSVSEGHQISETVRSKLIDEIEEVCDVLVHIDPENDALAIQGGSLPLRHEVMRRLRHNWEGIAAAQQIQSVTLHYLGGKIQVDVELPLTAVRDLREARAVSEAFSRAVNQDREIETVRVHYT